MTVPLALERYFFPIQKVEANPTHDPNLPIDIRSKLDFNAGQVQEQAGVYAVELTLSSTPDSINASYTYTITAFALLRVTDKTISADKLATVAAHFGAGILVGVTRERLAELTSRGPWPTVMLNTGSLDVLPSQDLSGNKKRVSEKRSGRAKNPKRV